MKRAITLVAVFWSAFAFRTASMSALGLHREPVPLRVPFSELPMNVCGPAWVGESVPLDEDVEKRAKLSAYVQRIYRSESAALWLYVGYVARWTPESIHHPDICFPGSGYEQVIKANVSIPIPDFSTEPRFREYLWNHPRSGGTYTLTSFYYNGKLEPDEWRLRMDSLSGIPYFAIITISGSRLGSIDETRQLYQGVAQRVIPEILKHFSK